MLLLQTAPPAQPAVRFDAEAYIRANDPLVRRNVAILDSNRGLREALRARGIRMDANLTAFLARELVHQTGLVEMTMYERNRIAEFVPADTSHPRGAQSYSIARMDIDGEAAIESLDLAGDDPRVDVRKTELLKAYINVRASYGYSVQELEEAAVARVNLPRWKGDACADVIARGVDKLGRVGSTKNGSKGFFNDPNVPVLTLGNGEWTTATVAQILADLNQIEDSIISGTADQASAFGPHTLVLPSVYHGVLWTTPRSDGSDMSIAQWFIANSRLIKSIESYSALDTATGADVAAADPPQGICYPRDPRVLHQPFAIAYEEQAPQLVGWEWIVRGRARVGSTVFRRPTHARYIENLD